MVFVTLAKALPGKAQQALQALASLTSLPAGAKMLSCYVTYGRYDAVCVWEAPDLASANRCMAAMMAEGLVTTETLLAQAPADFLK